jgi:excisionase family DNA binding protein
MSQRHRTILDQKLVAAGKMAYRINEACQCLGIGRTSLYELVKTGELKLIRIAGRTLVPRSEIERLTSIDRAA